MGIEDGAKALSAGLTSRVSFVSAIARSTVATTMGILSNVPLGPKARCAAEGFCFGEACDFCGSVQSQIAVIQGCGSQISWLCSSQCHGEAGDLRMCTVPDSVVIKFAF